MPEISRSEAIRALMPDLEKLKAELRAKTDQLFNVASGSQLRMSHWFAEEVFLQFSYDVWEQAEATLLIANGPSPRAAIPNARAAVEAALDMLVLLAEPSLYDEFGVFVRVCEILSNEDLHGRAKRLAAIKGITVPSVRSDPADKVVAEEARIWEAHQPGITTVYLRALAQARAESRSLRSRGRCMYMEKPDGAWPDFVPNFSFHSTISHGGPKCAAPVFSPGHSISSGRTAILRWRIRSPIPSGCAVT